MSEINRPAISEHERGKRTPSLTVLDSLAAALNPAVDGLIGQAVPEDLKEFQKWFLKILPALKRLDKRGQNIVKACLEAMPRV